jgi:LppP/LprE lipoprotein
MSRRVKTLTALAGLLLVLSTWSTIALAPVHAAGTQARAGNPFVSAQVGVILRMHQQIVGADYSHCPSKAYLYGTCQASQIRVTGAAWKSVADGHGGNLYAWLVSGGGNSRNFSVTFFDNARYVGQFGHTTAVFWSYYSMSPGTFTLQYKRYRTGDAMCCPSDSMDTFTVQYNAQSRSMGFVSPTHTAVAAQSASKCAFRAHEWGVVQATSDLINYADSTTHADQQSAVAHLEEKFFHIESRYGSPYGSGALFSDLSSAWLSAESASYDHDQFLANADPSGTAGDPSQYEDNAQTRFWSGQLSTDTAAAWAAQTNVWKDIKQIC